MAAGWMAVDDRAGGRVMASERRRQRTEQFWRFNYQWCNWVGEAVQV